MKNYFKLKMLFNNANTSFITKNKRLLSSEVSERSLCGQLMIELSNLVKGTEYKNYYLDVEYNRNLGHKLKTIKKNLKNGEGTIIDITCDLILHSRGEIVSQDNLIAIEMKKSTRRRDEKDKDRDRLICLTKDSFDDVYSFDGKTLPEHVCRYILGIYYEVNLHRNNILIEYYYKGKMQECEIITYTDN